MKIAISGLSGSIAWHKAAILSPPWKCHIIHNSHTDKRREAITATNSDKPLHTVVCVTVPKLRVSVKTGFPETIPPCEHNLLQKYTSCRGTVSSCLSPRIYKQKQTNSVASVRERTVPTERQLLAGVVPTFADRGCHVVSVTDPYGRILGFLDRSRYFFFQVAPQLYSRGRVDPVPDPLLLRKSGSAGDRTRTSRSVARNSDL
jgi:hypothetical protein